MSEFDDFVRGIGSDIKIAAEKVGKKAEKTFEISKRKAERISIKGNIQKNYQKLGELVYGGIKNDEDIQKEMEAIVAELDFDFARITEIYEEIVSIKNGTYVEEEAEDWEEEYAEEYDEEETFEEEPEVEVALVIEENGEISEEPAEVVTEETASKAQEFDINID